MILWLKFIHISAVVIWCAGLISLPGLYAQRARLADDDALYRLQALVRFAYVALVSPAAFVAIASGTGLVFLRQTFVAWFSVKLVFVTVLVLQHALTGLVIIRLFHEGEAYPAWRAVSVSLLTLAVVVAILVLVLAKPDFGRELLPAVFSEPGGLRRAAEDLNLWSRP